MTKAYTDTLREFHAAQQAFNAAQERFDVAKTKWYAECAKDRRRMHIEKHCAATTASGTYLSWCFNKPKANGLCGIPSHAQQIEQVRSERAALEMEPA